MTKKLIGRKNFIPKKSSEEGKPHFVKLPAKFKKGNVYTIEIYEVK